MEFRCKSGKEYIKYIIIKLCIYVAFIVFFVFLMLSEGVPLKIINLGKLILFTPLCLWVIYSILLGLLYRLRIQRDEGDTFSIVERKLIISRFKITKDDLITLVQPSTLHHRLPFIRISGDYNREFGELAGKKNLDALSLFLRIEYVKESQTFIGTDKTCITKSKGGDSLI